MYLIDGYNLLHALKQALPGQFPRAFHPARDRLLQLLSAFAGHHNTTVTVYFDGNSGRLEPGELALPGVRVRFCGPGDQTADRAICRDVEASANSAKLTVVSSDREVRTICRNEGAMLESSDQFLARLGGGAPVKASGSISARPAAGSKGSGTYSRSGKGARPQETARPQESPKSRPPRRQKATPPDGKPSGGHIGEIERKMIEEIGDLEDLERDTLDE